MSTPTRKPLAEYPEWRTKQCVHCKAGEPMGAMTGHHWTGDPDPPACTAQSAEEYIAELERRISILERHTLRQEWIDRKGEYRD